MASPTTTGGQGYAHEAMSAADLPVERKSWKIAAEARELADVELRFGSDAEDG